MNFEQYLGSIFSKPNFKDDPEFQIWLRVHGRPQMTEWYVNWKDCNARCEPWKIDFEAIRNESKPKE